MMSRSLVRHATLLALTAITPLACKSKPAAVQAASAQGSGSARLQGLAASVFSAAAKVRKTPADLVTPPLTPPADAQQAAEGVKWKLIRDGDGSPPSDDDALDAELSVWTGEGKLAFTSYSKGGPIAASVRVVPAAVYEQLRKIKPGGQALFWFPAAFIHALGPGRHSFPDTDLIIEYEPISARARPASTVLPGVEVGQAPAGPAPSQFPPPDAAGPPPTALTSPNGLRYVQLRAATGTTKATPASKLQLALTVWPVTGLLVEQPAIRNQASATTLARAPAGLGQILQGLSEGAIVRVWLPPSKAGLVVPLAKNQEAVLDLTLEKIE